MPVSPRHRPLLAVLATVAVVWFLKASRPVTMPLAFGVFLTVLMDPVRAWLARRVPSPAAVGLTFLLALVGLGVIQLVLGAWLDPKLQGRYLELSAFVVLVSITFWGWAWGIAGAFIAVPLTAAVVVAVGEFEQTEWLARLLTRERSPRSG